MKPIEINPIKCTLCGLCLTQCTSGKLEKKDSQIVVTQNECIGCGHCYAICPTQAIVPENKLKLEPSLKEKISSQELQTFFRSRRSHRIYINTPIEESKISKLIDFAKYAPTGSNAQGLCYLIIKDPEKIDFVKKEVMRIYARFNKLIHNPLIRFIISLFDKRAKKKELRDSLAKMMKRYENNEDPLFHNAPLIVFVYAKKENTSTPKDDACYALLQMTLGAETLGLSSCINGLSMIGLSQNRKLKKYLGFTKGYKAYACAGFGYPKYTYQNLVFRKDPLVKVL